jgi:hypothetical protein
LMEETEVPGENQRPVASYWQTWSHIMLYRVEYTSPWVGLELTLVVLVSDCTDSCKSNYHTITTMMAPSQKQDTECSWYEGLKSLCLFSIGIQK